MTDRRDPGSMWGTILAKSPLNPQPLGRKALRAFRPARRRFGFRRRTLCALRRSGLRARRSLALRGGRRSGSWPRLVVEGRLGEHYARAGPAGEVRDRTVFVLGADLEDDRVRAGGAEGQIGPHPAAVVEAPARVERLLEG